MMKRRILAFLLSFSLVCSNMGTFASYAMEAEPEAAMAIPNSETVQDVEFDLQDETAEELAEVEETEEGALKEETTEESGEVEETEEGALEESTETVKYKENVIESEEIKNATEEITAEERLKGILYQEGAKSAEGTYEYYYQDVASMLPGWTHEIRIEYYHQESNSWGWTMIEGASIELGEEIPENAIEVYQNENGNWQIRANEFGYGTVTVTFKNSEEDVETQQRTIEVYVGSDVWNMEHTFSHGTSEMIWGSTVSVKANLTHECFDPEFGHFMGSIDNVEYAWEYLDGTDENVLKVTQSEEDASEFVFEAPFAENFRNAGIRVRVYLLDEEGNREKDLQGNDLQVIERVIEVYLTNGYVIVEPYGDTEEVEVGETFEINPAMILHYVEEDGTLKQENLADMEGITANFSFNWDSEVLALESDGGNNTGSLMSEPGKNHTFIRTENRHTDLEVKGYITFEDEESGEEVTRERAGRNYTFPELNYRVWVEDGLRENGRTWIYKDEEYRLRLNTDNLSGRNAYWMNIQLGYWEDDIFVDYPAQAELFTMDGNWIILYGEQIKEVAGDRGYASLRVQVTNEDRTKHYADESYHIDIKDTVYDYNYSTYGMSMLPHWEQHIDSNLNYYIENSEYPYGIGQGSEGYEPIKIENISLELLDDTKKGAIEIVEKEDGSGWIIKANDFGHGKVTLEHPNSVNGEENVVHQFDVWVSDEVWQMSHINSNGADNLLPGDSLVANIKMQRPCFDAEREMHYQGNASEVEYTWEYWGNTNEELLTVEPTGENPAGFILTAAENVEEGREVGIRVRAYLLNEEGNRVQDNEGNDIQVAEEDIILRIEREYLVIQPHELEALYEVGEEFAVKPVLKKIYLDENGERREVNLADEPENGTVSFRWNWDNNVLELQADENSGNAVTDVSTTLTFKRLKTWGTNIHIAALITKTDEYGNEETYQVYDRDLELEENNYNLYFENLRGKNHTWMFTNSSYTLDLNTDSIEGKNNTELVWQLGNFENDNFVELENSENYYRLEDDNTITFDGVRLAEDEIGGFVVRAIVYSNEVKTDCEVSVYVSVDEPEYTLEDDGDDDIVFEEGAGWVYDNDNMTVFIRNEHYPQGKEIEATIRNIYITDGDNNFTITHNEDEHRWYILVEEHGWCRLGIELVDETENGMGALPVLYRDKSVASTIYRTDVYTKNSSQFMLPGESIQLVTDVYRFERNEEGELFSYMIPQIESNGTTNYILEYLNYDENIIEVSEDGRVTGKNEGETNISVKAVITVNAGTENAYEYERWNNIRVFVYDSYTELSVDAYFTKPLRIIDIQDLNPRIKSVDKEEGVEYFQFSDVEFRNEDDELFFTLWKNKKLIVNAVGDSYPITRRVGIVGWDEDGNEYGGWTYITVCDHDYQLTNVLHAATCDDDGQGIYTCRHCEHTKEDIIVATKHKWNDRVVAATLSKDGYTIKDCINEGCDAKKNKKAIKKVASVTTSAISYVYDGKEKKPTVVVKDSAGKALKNGTDYTVTYPAASTNVGSYTVTVTLKGNYSGSKVMTYEILPKAAALASLTPAGESFTAKWSKVTSQITGYQLQYSLKSNFSGAKMLNVKGASTVSKAVTKLEPATRYYVRIRTYHIVGGKYYYSAWSAAKNTITKVTNPKATAIASLSPASKSFTIKWKKGANDITGYEIQYGLKSNFSGAKTVKVTSKTAVSKKITGVKGAKKYYVRIRTYKTVARKNYYSAWSAAKNVTTKK